MKRILLSLLFPTLLVAQVPGPGNNRVLLPNGWSLSPYGEQADLGDFPMNGALTEDQQLLAVTHSGYSKPELMLVDLEAKKVVQSIVLKDSWLGIKFVGKKLYVSGGNQNCVYVFTLAHKQLTPSDTIRFEQPKYFGSASGLDVFGNRLAVVFRNDSTLRFYDLNSKKKELVKLGGMPYSCKFVKDGILLVSLWSSSRVEIYVGSQLLNEFETGAHPTEITTSHDGRYAYVANANDNTVTVLDLSRNETVANVVTAVYPDAPEGSTTNSVALTSGGNLALAANADNNSLTVINLEDPKRPRPVGFIPVGWYPTKVLVRNDNKVIVLNGKGGRSLANPEKTYIAKLLKGTLSIFDLPSNEQLLTLSKQVIENTPYKNYHLTESKFEGENPIPRRVGAPSPIKHVFYIIKENRTYDQVFGDMPEGNGDTSLCIFGETITPNHHKLVRQFVLFDNLYVNAEVSADGHNWSTAGYATDYIEKLWPTNYGGRGGLYDFEGSQPTGTPKSGYIWDACARAGVSYRSYGEFTQHDSAVAHSTTLVKGLIGHFDPAFRGWDLTYSDLDREKEWERELAEFEANGNLPQFNILRLPNDHTEGTRKGKLTPRAFVAQNDLALGRFVDRLSKSKYWAQSAIFVIEDDAQDGPDHVDAHRTVGLVISPYTRRGFVDHTLYTTASMLRTMELILGVAPMSQYDASATPFFNAFSMNADTTGFQVEAPRYDLTAKNRPGDYGQVLMEEMDFRKEDAAPDRLFNQIIWRSIKGTAMPAPRYSIFSGSSDEDHD